MKPETAYLLSLLRAFIQGETAPSLPENVDGDALARLARAGDVGGIVGYMTQPFIHSFTEKTAAFLTAQFYGTVGNFANKGVACDALFAQLRAAGIPFAVLKGAVLGHLYPMRCVRSLQVTHCYLKTARKYTSNGRRCI